MDFFGFIWAILFFVIAMSPLVVLHELGHYGVGRLFGVKAEVFSVGFGRPLIGRTDRHGTHWQIASIPLGGYVRFAGDMSAASEPSDEWLRLPPEERNRTFQSKPVWQRALIVLAGPMTNFALAAIVLSILFSIYGEPRLAPVAGNIQPGSPAMAAGIRTGDRIVSVDGQDIARFEDISVLIQVRAGIPTSVVIERGGARQVLSATPRAAEIKDLTGAKTTVGQLGIAPGVLEHVRLSPLELPGAGVRFTVQAVKTMAYTLGQIVTGQRAVTQLGGPVKIAKMSGAMANYGVVEFIGFMMMISINLGFINLLPIPTLDGGHLAFYAVEAVRRKPVGLAAQEWAYRGGLLVLLAFVLFVTVNDLGLLNGLAGLIG